MSWLERIAAVQVEKKANRTERAQRDAGRAAAKALVPYVERLMSRHELIPERGDVWRKAASKIQELSRLEMDLNNIRDPAQRVVLSRRAARDLMLAEGALMAELLSDPTLRYAYGGLLHDPKTLAAAIMCDTAPSSRSERGSRNASGSSRSDRKRKPTSSRSRAGRGKQ